MRSPALTSSMSLVERAVFTTSGAIIAGKITTSPSGSTGITRGWAAPAAGADASDGPGGRSAGIVAPFFAL